MTTRRDLLLAALAAAWPNAASDLSVEGYIFQQYAEHQNKPLGEVIPEVLAMARKAGFKNIELSPAFFAGKLHETTFAALRAEDLRMPSMYVGGAMHSKALADETIANALEHARMAKPFGCKGIVNNPDPKPGDAAKTYEELYAEADGLNRLGHALRAEGFDLRVHHHTPQLENNAREWRYLLANTNPANVHICVDVDWAYEGGFDPVEFLREVGDRLREIHVRSARNKIWLEEVTDSDIDYRAVAAYLRSANLHPLIVVELAYRPHQTTVTRPLEEDLRRSRLYTEKVLGVTS
jgi:sugar phosphate isomerase/epimerase